MSRATKSLARRGIHYQSIAHWLDTLRWVEVHSAPSAKRAARNMRKKIRGLKNTPLLHKGRKP